MKSVCLLFVLILALTAAEAQQVIASAGSSGSITGYTVDWTLGEPVIETFTGAANRVTQGIHQTKLMVTALRNFDIPEMEVKVYPNPARDMVTIELAQGLNQRFTCELTDLTGQKMIVKEMSYPAENLDLKDFAPGIYLLRIFTPILKIEKVFKIVKH